ncbi:DnaD/phage-associated family protein [Clostridium pascui]|uniref:DnaD domain-containing protein n=1 Tax=Clostridium pascui TaxID=46609 RepID=UPI00195B735C|nr:DnaD domain protein [Clostridium pascui]MBM7869854.1 DnaD/phage-associated family protein [Clostridium pascui]
MDKKCVVIDVNLAVVLGVSESIILQQMSYWLEKSTHIIEGRPWIFNSYANWQKQLPFFCESTIRRLIKKLEDMGIILSSNFNKCKMDKTKWYSIDYDALNKLQEKDDNLIYANKEQMDEATHQGNYSNLAVDEINLTKAIPEITPETNLKDVVVVENGARPLEGKVSFEYIINFFSSNLHLPTPYEREKLRLLYEDLNGGDLIIKAMEIAVENRVRTFRYIESILYNWTDLGLHTISEVQEYMQSYKEALKIQRDHLENKGSTSEVAKERKDDSHGTKKCSNWGNRQHPSYNKKTQREVQGKYAGFRPDEPEFPEFTDEDFAEFL